MLGNNFLTRAMSVRNVSLTDGLTPSPDKMNKLVSAPDNIIKFGYLITQSQKNGRNWKKRYFVLTETSFKYYADHSSTDTLKGDLAIKGETVVEETDRKVTGRNFCLTIKNNLSNLVVISAKDEQEMIGWKDAIEQVIINTSSSIKGYAMKVERDDDMPVLKYFIFHNESLSYHQDENHTGAIQGIMKLTSTTKINFDEDFLKISLSDPSNDMKMAFQFEKVNREEYDKWKSALSKSINTDIARIEQALAESVKQGRLKVRPPKGGDLWEEREFVLTTTEMILFERAPGGTGFRKIHDVYHIYPSCSVFETNLGPYAFELVTSEKVLHVMAESKESTTLWMAALKEVIMNADPEPNEPLLLAALKKNREDVFYDVVFREDRPLGVVLERTGEWAVVKLSNARDTGVYVGSALISVNGIDVTRLSYAQTIEKLKNWKPPLQLGFRKAPFKAGFLNKQARTSRSNSRKNWKPRYFILDEGRLMYKENDTTDMTLKGDVPLMGSAVSLAQESETGRPFCLKLVSGVTYLIMAAPSAEEQLDWAATLYHAIAIANGGAHLLALEKYEAFFAAEERKAIDGTATTPAVVEEEPELPLALNTPSKVKFAETVEDILEPEVVLPPTPPAEAEVSSDAVADVPSEKEGGQTQVTVSADEIAASETELQEALDAAQAGKGLDTLYEVIERARQKGIDVEAAVASYHAMKQKEAQRQEVDRMLKFALLYRSLAGMKEALAAADDADLSELDSYIEVKAAYVDMEQSELKRKEEEQARLAREAEELDNELKNDNQEDDEEDEKDDDKDDEDLDEVDESVGELLSEVDARKPDNPLAGNPHHTSPDRHLRNWSMNLNKAPKFQPKAKKEVSYMAADYSEELPDINSVKDEDIARVFDAYGKRGDSSIDTINPMKFSSIWRMLTGDKGNMFMEMQIFHKFDVNNNGALSREDFIAGWRTFAAQPGGERLVRKIKTLTENESCIL